MAKKSDVKVGKKATNSADKTKKSTKVEAKNTTKKRLSKNSRFIPRRINHKNKTKKLL